VTVTIKRKPKRSKLAKSEARQRYITIGELVALEQIQEDATLLGSGTLAIGPFARLDANAVAARDGKSRGAITNLFGSQAAFQAETMALALNASEWVDRIVFPRPGDYPTADAWFDVLLADQSGRGPVHGATPEVVDGQLWSLWISVVPYGIWSEEVARPSLAEHVQWVRRLEECFKQALDHFGLTLREGTTANDLAYAFACLSDGTWLMQCMSGRHPCDASEPIATAMRRSGRLLWKGAIEPPGAV
jgi:hypothetical protein